MHCFDLVHLNQQFLPFVFIFWRNWLTINQEYDLETNYSICAHPILSLKLIDIPLQDRVNGIKQMVSHYITSGGSLRNLGS